MKLKNEIGSDLECENDDGLRGNTVYRNRSQKTEPLCKIL